MKNQSIKDRPYGLLLVAAAILFVALLLPPLANLNVQGMTMFAVSVAVLVWAIPLLLAGLWLLYLQTDRFLFSKIATWVHVVLTVATTMLVAVILSAGMSPSLTDQEEFIGSAAQAVFTIFVVGQFVLLANIVAGLFTKGKRVSGLT